MEGGLHIALWDRVEFGTITLILLVGYLLLCLNSKSTNDIHISQLGN